MTTMATVTMALAMVLAITSDDTIKAPNVDVNVKKLTATSFPDLQVSLINDG